MLNLLTVVVKSNGCEIEERETKCVQQTVVKICVLNKYVCQVVCKFFLKYLPSSQKFNDSFTLSTHTQYAST